MAWSATLRFSVQSRFERLCPCRTRKSRIAHDYRPRGRVLPSRAMLHEKRRIRPAPLDRARPDVADLIDTYFNAYNAARLREASHAFARMIDNGASIGLSLSGAL